MVDKAGQVWQQNNVTGTFDCISTSDGATDISVGMDGSVWISRVLPGKKGKSDTAQYVFNSATFKSFGPTATSVSAFDFMYAAVTDTLSTDSNYGDIQSCDILGLNSMIMSYLSRIVAAYLPWEAKYLY